jgi:hypothetical protein
MGVGKNVAEQELLVDVVFVIVGKETVSVAV